VTAPALVHDEAAMVAGAAESVVTDGPLRAARLAGGASRQSWRLDGDDGAPRYALQLKAPWASGFGIAAADEADVLRAVAAAGVPVPEVLAASDGAEPFGMPFLVTRWVDGEARPLHVLRDESLALARGRLAADYARALAALQRVDVAPLRLPAVDPRHEVRSRLDAIGHAHPVIEFALRWLDRHEPAGAPAPVLVHGDYRNGNGIVGPDGLRAVIDWESARLGSPFEDLAWFCIRAWRYGAPLEAGGLASIDDFLAAYGRPVDREEFHWWLVAETARWAATCLLEGATHLSGVRRSVELAAVGRRVAEAEYDLMLLLA
jgi:aminoglycoside phosphotransferase (APT) family kinase protein